MREALLYEKEDDQRLHCYLCSHHCRIADEQFGICGVRQNKKGVLYTHVYGRPIAMHVDPIEKKPFYHFFPGSRSFSIATIGCNFHCGFCQNWEISQARTRDGVKADRAQVSPQEIVQTALEHECKGISYTYTEPTIFFEYAQDIAKLAKEKGLYNNFVTNGYMTKECLEMITPYLDAANVDLKFFKEESYKKICGARLGPVLEAIRYMCDLGIWVEITTLIVPGDNDTEEELTGIAQFIASVDKDIPWHISRFHPDYQFSDHQATPIKTLEKAQEIGYRQGLTYIYIGNVGGLGNDTVCPYCKKLITKREGYRILEYNIQRGKCSWCQKAIPGLFSVTTPNF